MHRHQGIAQLRAKQEAYGHKLDGKTVIRILGAQCLIYFAYSEVLFMRLWIAIIITLVAMVVGYSTLVVPEISINYYRNGLKQRDIFMSNLTQALSGNQTQTLITDLDYSKVGLYGEFKQDVDKLENVIQHNGHSPIVHKEFSKFRNKYSEDSFFVQFLEQLENANQTGDYDPKTFDELSTFHQQVFHQQQNYQRKRDDNVHKYYIYLIILLVAFVGAVIGFGWNNYLSIFAHSALGTIGSIIFLIILTVGLHMEFKYDHDESLMTI